jgi:hypothetical protein
MVETDLIQKDSVRSKAIVARYKVLTSHDMLA